MAIENAKRLNVRIRNKYDSYENWMSSGLVLEAGEIAIAYTSVDVTVDGGKAKHPALLMKVGDGAKTFANLPWLSAKAADVLSVCKNETELTTFVNNVIANAGIATDAAMKELAGKVTTAEGAIDALEALVGTDKVADQITAAIAALNLDTTYAAKEHKHVKADITDFAHGHVMADVEGLVDALAGNDTAGEAAKVQDALDEYIESNDAAVALKADKTALEAEASTARAAEKANADAIAAINNEETGVLAQAKAYADGLDSAMNTRVAGLEAKFGDEEGGVKDQIDAAVKVEKERAMEVEGGLETRLAAVEADYLKEADIADMATDAEVEAAVKAEADRAKGIEQDLEERLAAVEGDYLKAADKTALEGKITANANAIELLTNGVSAEEVDGVNDLIQYVKDHGTEVTGMKADIAANTKAIGDEEARAKGVEQGLDTRLGAAEGEIDALQADSHTHANKALLDTYTQTEADLADAVAKKHAHANAAVLDGISAEKVAAWDAAEGNAKAYTDALRDGAVKANADAIAGIVADYLKAADKTELEGKITTAQTELDALELLVGTEKVADQIDAKIEELDLANTYEEKGAAADALQDAKDYVDGKDTAMAERVAKLEVLDFILNGDSIVLDCGDSKVVD
jgi:hypothetical protein